MKCFEKIIGELLNGIFSLLWITTLFFQFYKIEAINH
jgi:hypothetical protein